MVKLLFLKKRGLIDTKIYITSVDDIPEGKASFTLVCIHKETIAMLLLRSMSVF